MNGFPAAEVERLAAGTNLLPRHADEMHLDAMLFLVVAREMAKTRKVEPSAKLAIDAREEVEVEGRRDPGIVVIGGGEYVRVLDQIDADDEKGSRPEQCG